VNILNLYTYKTLKENKSRTLVTIVGIILSLAMLTCVTTLISTSQAWLKNSVMETYGNWHGVILEADEEVRRDMLMNGDIRHSFALHHIGFSPLDDGTEHTDYIFTAAADSEFFRNMPVEITRGRLPETRAEVIVPENMYINGNRQYTLGQEITLLTGRREYMGESLYTHNPFVEGEVLKDTEYRNYTVVGFYRRPSLLFSVTGPTLLTGDWYGDCKSDIYYISADIRDTYRIMDRYTGRPYYCGSVTNTTLLRFSGTAATKGYNATLYSLGVILMTIIVFASIALIYNAFSISIGERTRQFGLLSSIGATRRQLRASVVAEALMLCVIGVPLGIAAGLAGIAFTLEFIQNVFSLGFEEISFAGAENVVFDMVVSPYAIGIAAAIGILTIMVSAWLPARKALRNTAIDALRLTNEIKLTPKDIKSNPLPAKLLGVEATVAARNFRRSKRRYRATVISLFMSVVLFVSAWSFCQELEKSIGIMNPNPAYDLVYYHYPETEELSMETLRERFMAVDGVENVFYSHNLYMPMPFSDDVLTEEYRQLWAGGDDYMHIVFMDDESFYAWAHENGHTDLPAKGEITGFAVNAARKHDYEKDVYYDARVFKNDKISFTPPAVDTPVNLRICSRLPMNMDKVRDTFVMAVLPHSCMDMLFPGSGYATGSIMVSAANPNETEKKLADIVALPGNIVNSYREYQTNRAIIGIVKVFTYGFIALISLIACANVFNTISTNVALRRREFAVLRSVGMSGRSFDRMMIYECMLYGTKSVLMGLPVSLAVSLWIYSAVRRGFSTAYRPPLQGMAIAVAGVFIVVIITMIYATRRIKRENVIDALKDENL